MIVYTSSKEQIRLSDEPFSSGGEGEVRAVESAPSRFTNVCVKIYYQKKRSPQQEQKINFMASNPPSKVSGTGFMIGWPLATVYDADSKFMGFVMPLAPSGSKQLVNLTAVKLSKKLDGEWQRKYDRALGKSSIVSRLKLLNNISIPIHLLHSTGKYVLKDFKPQNVLVTHTGQVTIVDMDSVQIMDGSRLLFPGTAATDIYMPPEFYTKGVGRDISKPLNKSWDLFALGVVFYQVLFGLHPFVVTPWVMKDDSSNDISQNIAQGLFPFGRNAHKVKGYPELHNNFNILPKQLQEMFSNAFSEDSNVRPSAESWGKTIYGILAGVGGGQPNPSPRPTPTPPKPIDFLDVPTSSIYFNANGGSKTIVIKSSPAWSIRTNMFSWGKAFKVANNLTVQVEENKSSSTRNDYVTLCAGSKTVKISVSQAAGTQPTPPNPTPTPPNPTPPVPPKPPVVGPAPDNHLTKAIIATIFCCLPLGVISLIKATKVDSLWAQGNYEAARESASSADTWANVSMVIGIISFIIGLLANL